MELNWFVFFFFLPVELCCMASVTSLYEKNTILSCDQVTRTETAMVE
jgi:hypothetical protein